MYSKQDFFMKEKVNFIWKFEPTK